MNISDAIIIPKLQAYLRLQVQLSPESYDSRNIERICKLLEPGICHGFLSLLSMKSDSEKKKFIAQLERISEWDERPKSLKTDHGLLEKIFDHVIQDIRLLQGILPTLRIFHQDFIKLRAYIRDKSDDSDIFQVLNYGCLFNRENLMAMVKELFDTNLEIHIGSKTHIVGLSFLQGQRVFVNSNLKSGFQDITLNKEAINTIFEALFPKSTQWGCMNISAFYKCPMHIEASAVRNLESRLSAIKMTNLERLLKYIQAEKLEHFFDVNKMSAVLTAVRTKDIDTLERLLQMPALNLSIANPYRALAINDSIKIDSQAIFNMLAEHPSCDLFGRGPALSPLHIAAHHNKVHYISLISDRIQGALEPVDPIGKTPFMYAAAANNLTAMKLLRKRFPGTLNRQDNNGNTALHHVAKSGRLNTLQHLLQIPGVHSGARNKQGASALEIAALYNRKHSLRYLIQSLVMSPIVMEAQKLHARMIRKTPKYFRADIAEIVIILAPFYQATRRLETCELQLMRIFERPLIDGFPSSQPEYNAMLRSQMVDLKQCYLDHVLIYANLKEQQEKMLKAYQGSSIPRNVISAVIKLKLNELNDVNERVGQYYGEVQYVLKERLEEQPIPIAGSELAQLASQSSSLKVKSK